MKYLVTAPPGALGHFLSRVINNDYDFHVGDSGQYHSLSKNYSSQTTSIEQYAGAQDTDQKVICLHNFDNRDLSNQFPDRTVINVVVTGCWDLYLNNFYRKAIQSHGATEQDYLNSVETKFPNSTNSLREEFYWLYLDAVNGKVPWLPTSMSGLCVDFCDFYNQSGFENLLSQIPGIKIDNVEQIWNHFYRAQDPLISRQDLYTTICQTVVQGQKPVIPDYFDNVDFGIMCGIIQHKFGVDLLNLNKDSWP